MNIDVAHVYLVYNLKSRTPEKIRFASSIEITLECIRKDILDLTYGQTYRIWSLPAATYWKKNFKHYKGIEILALNSKGRANPAHHALWRAKNLPGPAATHAQFGTTFGFLRQIGKYSCFVLDLAYLIRASLFTVLITMIKQIVFYGDK